MWPFTKKSKPIAVPRKSSPCGNDDAHHYWHDKGWVCPCCSAEANARHEKQARDDQAENIARRVARIMKESQP